MKELRKLFENQVLENPLDEKLNSIKNHNVINRSFLSSNGKEWRFIRNNKTFKLGNIYQFNLSNDAVSIFDDKNFKRIYYLLIVVKIFKIFKCACAKIINAIICCRK